MPNGMSGTRVHVLCLGYLSWNGHCFRIRFREKVLPVGMVAGGGRQKLSGLQDPKGKRLRWHRIGWDRMGCYMRRYMGTLYGTLNEMLVVLLRFEMMWNSVRIGKDDVNKVSVR